MLNYWLTNRVISWRTSLELLIPNHNNVFREKRSTLFLLTSSVDGLVLKNDLPTYKCYQYDLYISTLSIQLLTRFTFFFWPLFASCKTRPRREDAGECSSSDTQDQTVTFGAVMYTGMDFTQLFLKGCRAPLVFWECLIFCRKSPLPLLCSLTPCAFLLLSLFLLPFSNTVHV